MSFVHAIRKKYRVEVKALAQAVHISEIPKEYKHLPIIARGNTSIILEKDPKTVIMVTRDSMKKDWLHIGIELSTDFKYHDIKAKNRAFTDVALYSIEMPKLYKPNNANQTKIRKEVAFFEKAQLAVGGKLAGKDKLPELVEYYEKNGLEKSIFIPLFNFLMNYYPEQWHWDIARRQFAQDADGNLVLLDPIANAEMLKAMFKKK